MIVPKSDIKAIYTYLLNGKSLCHSRVGISYTIDT